MKRKELPRSIFLVIALVVLAIAIPLSGGCTPAPAPGPAPGVTPAEPIYHWRGQASQYVVQVEDYWQPWADELEAALGGRAELEIFSAGELMPDSQVFQAVQKGTLDFGLGLSSPIAGVPTETVKFGSYCPFGWENDLDLLVMWDYYGLDEPYTEAWEELGGIKFLNVWTGDPGHIITSKPVRSWEDLQGLKLVAYDNVAAILGEAGAVCVDIPVEEFFLAGTTGVIDGLAGWCGAYESYANGFYEVFPYFLTQPLGVWHNFDIVNLETWNSLPSDVQDAILVSLHAHRMRTVQYYWYGELKSYQYHTLTTMPEEDWAKLVEIGERYWDEWAKDGPKAQQIVDIVRTYRQECGR